VIKELEENLKKIKNIAKKEFYQFIIRNNFIVREKISNSEIKPFLNLVDEKDAHVVAGAILTDCDYLVTLDKKHLNNTSVKAKIRKIKIVSPKESLTIILARVSQLSF
jgi:predicted nucleic acid-binding protein